MKIKQQILVSMLVLCCTGIARAETVLGTVTAVDSSGQNVTLKRTDTSGTMTVHVPELASLNSLPTGSQVSLNANRSGSGWEAQSFKISSDSSSQQMAGQAADLNAAGGPNAAR